MKNLLLIGTNHRVAPVEIRSRIAAAFGAVRTTLPCDVTGQFLLSTCHRAELYVVTGAEDLEQRLREQISTYAGAGDVAGALYVSRGLDAARHLARVACGLDSVVIGEAEIAGQIRRALQSSRETGAVGPALDRVVTGALRASGRARSETRIAAGVLSAPSAAVALVDRACGGLAGRAVLVVGAGEAGRLALARLKKQGAGRRLVASRSAHHAHEAAAKYGATVLGLDRLADAAAGVDAVIAAAQAPSCLLMAGDYEAASTGRTVCMVDLSAPRVLDPALARVAGVTLHTIDDLGDIVHQSTTRRLAEIPRVESIVAEEARRAFAAFEDQVRRAQGTN